MTTPTNEPSRSRSSQREPPDPQADGHAQCAASTGTPATNRPQPASSLADNGVSLPAKLLNGAPSLVHRSASPSAAPSPLSSRDTSPVRPTHRQPGMSPAQQRKGAGSRKSSQDVSPSRTPSLPGAGGSGTVLSAAAIQRALSSSNTPQLQPTVVQDASSRIVRPQKVSSGTTSGDNTPHWPVSPRLKSPPPTGTRSRRNSLRAQPRKTDSPAPALGAAAQGSASNPVPRTGSRNDILNSDSEDQAPLTMKVSARGASGAGPTLETVQEASLPTPGFGNAKSHAATASEKTSDDDRSDMAVSKVSEDLSGKVAKAAESGSESGGNKSEGRGRSVDPRMSALQKPRLPSRTSFTSLAPGKAKSAGEIASKNMTVETETVTSIPQPAIGGPTDRSIQGRADPSGSLRLKPSNETIRPKKDRKKAARKAPSITSGTGRSHVPSYLHLQHRPNESPEPRPRLNMNPTVPFIRGGIAYPLSCWAPAQPRFENVIPIDFYRSQSYRFTKTDLDPRKASSKADIFEAKVASAVDEANSSDSDETFVYESNPPDTQPQRSRHHSRTPSATSMASIGDHRSAVRSIGNVLAGKRSMKFANNPYNNPSPDNDYMDRQEGTVRAGNSRTSGGSGVHHHHIGRFGRGGAHHTSLFDNDSPFPQGGKNRTFGGRHSSRPSSPRFPNHNLRVSNGNGSKKSAEMSSYDMDVEGAADDERTPLIGTVRGPRTRTPRRPNSASLRQLEHYQRRRRGWLRRFAGCIVMTIMLLLLVFGAVGFLFATTKPLYDVGVREIQNVLASEQEIMLDLLVGAVNPNVIAVTIADMDVNLFAKSKHVGTDKWWREHQELVSAARALTITVDHADYNISGNVDEGTDPIPDPEGDSQTMLLGRIFHFDSALIFDGSPLKRHPHYSVGEVRLAKPGNKTEAGGTARWERVIQYPFELIVRGVLKYQLPLSSRTHTAAIGASILVQPEKSVDGDGTMHIETNPKHSRQE